MPLPRPPPRQRAARPFAAGGIGRGEGAAWGGCLVVWRPWVRARGDSFPHVLLFPRPARGRFRIKKQIQFFVSALKKSKPVFNLARANFLPVFEAAVQQTRGKKQLACSKKSFTFFRSPPPSRAQKRARHLAKFPTASAGRLVKKTARATRRLAAVFPTASRRGKLKTRFKNPPRFFKFHFKKSSA